MTQHFKINTYFLKWILGVDLGIFLALGASDILYLTTHRIDTTEAKPHIFEIILLFGCFSIIFLVFLIAFRKIIFFYNIVNENPPSFDELGKYYHIKKDQE